MTSKELQEQRNKIFHDYFNNVVPERMPVDMSVYPMVLATRSELNLVDTQFNYTNIEKAANDLDEFAYSDVCPLGAVGWVSRVPGIYQLMDSQAFMMASNGQMQHPEVTGMLDSEYDLLTKDAYACLIETVIPRQHKALDPNNPDYAIRINLIKSELQRQMDKAGAVLGKLINEKGYYSGAPKGSNGFSAAPFDFLADLLRGFSGICKDVRRHREEVKEACEVLLPLMFHLGMPVNPDPEGSVGMPLHMPTYLRAKDFEELWLPSYLELVNQYAARGVRTKPFLEENWMKYLDNIKDFPAGTILRFEQGDPKLVKEKLGDKFLITGLYPLMLLKTGTKEEVIDKAKEVLDIMLPGCGYMFGFDKNLLLISDTNTDNYRELSYFLRNYAKFDNAGESFGTKLNSENFEIDNSIGDFKSKYLVDWDEYKAKYPLTPDYVKENLFKDEVKELQFFLNLLV